MFAALCFLLIAAAALMKHAEHRTAEIRMQRLEIIK